MNIWYNKANKMQKVPYFVIGLVTGIYVDQKYKLPSVSVIVERIIKYAKENEKK